ncbi:MAG: MerR family transcriptional regulator [Gammaproteobacteria bacterium]|nr:MerR family transcriptional regulator [Gammaproteobacteria bacterium]
MNTKAAGRAEPGLTIGRLAAVAGVNVETVRYYQRIGLIIAPVKPARGYRRYPPDAVERIRFIKRAQELGFNLREIAELLSLNDGDCNEARLMAEHKLEAIRRRMDDLGAMAHELTALIVACRDHASRQGRCAIIASLGQDKGRNEGQNEGQRG